MPDDLATALQPVDAMFSEIDDLLPDLIALRHDLHAHPELAFAEHRTAELVAQALRHLGLEVHAGIGGTGVVGVLRHGSGSGSVALRSKAAWLMPA